jgi:hypothetical protein
MPRITLPTYASFLITSGPSRVTKVRQARKAREDRATYPAGDHYIHLRAPLRNAVLAGGDVRTLQDALSGLRDPKKVSNYTAIISGLAKIFTTIDFDACLVPKRSWTHGELTVDVNPTCRLRFNGQWHVAYIHLNRDPLDARAIQPILELMRLTHGDLGEPVLIDARRGRLHHPSRSANVRRNLGDLLAAEADAFVSLWNRIGRAA